MRLRPVAVALSFVAPLTLLVAALSCGTHSSTTQPAPPNVASPVFSAQPASLTVAAGGAAAFSASVDGLPAPTFQWQRSNDGGSTWTAIAGATGTTYTLAAASIDDTLARFELVATNTQGTATSSTAILTVTASVGTTSQVTLAPKSAPLGIATGPDGNVWFTNQTAGQIGVIPAVTHVPVLVTLPNPACAPTGITAGPDGRMWFTEQAAANVGVISLDGQTVHEYAAQGTSPTGIAAGPDGALWYTLQGANAIGRITPAGSAVTFPVTTAAALPQGIALGQVDGNLWFTENAAGQIARISAAGAVTEWVIPTPSGGVAPAPTGIVATADGALWFSDAANSQVVKFVPPSVSAATASARARARTVRAAGGVLSDAGLFTPVPLPTGALPQGLTVDSAGNVWVANAGTGTVSRISPTSLAVTSYSLPAGASGQATNVVIGSDGSLYVTQPGGDAITQVTTVAGTGTTAVTVGVRPATTQTQAGLTVQFAAQVTGNTNTQVTWTLQEGSAGGSVTSTGLYTAPLTAGTYHVVATSQADPTKAATAAVTVAALPAPAITSFSASPATVTAGTSTTFTGVFANGIGVITPGNLTLVSGGTTSAAVAADTTYTLTVTNAAGSAVTQTTAVTVVAAAATPVVTAPAHVTAGATGLAASVPVQTGDTYAWTITGGTITAGGTTNAITFSAGTSGSVVLTCVVSNSLGTPSAPGTATCAIVAPPAIASFVTTTPSTGPGGSAGLLASFTGGTGSVDHGVGTVTSGTAATATGLTATTTFTLTVTNAAGAAVTATASTRVGELSVFAGVLANEGNADGTGAAARFADPFGLALDGAGNLYVADSYNCSIRKITPAGVVTTLAGLYTGVPLANGTGAAAGFGYPEALAVDSAGNVLVADVFNQVIRKVTPAGVVTTFAGSGAVGSQNGQGTTASFHDPYGIAVDGSGNLYVADLSNRVIRLITPGGMVSTFAGSGSYGYQDGPAASAMFLDPRDVAVDASGNVYVADSETIRKISGGVVSTLAGTGAIGSANGAGATATFYAPRGLAVDGSGNVYVADSDNAMIRKITPGGTVSTLAGTGTSGSLDGPALSATFDLPRGVAADAAGNVYVADSGNNLIRKVSSGGTVTTLAGAPPANGVAGGVTFSYPQGLAFDGSGNLYVADSSALIWKLTPQGVASMFAGSDAFSLGISAPFSMPAGLAFDAAGNLYTADEGANMIFKITPAGGVSTLAGNGDLGYIDGPGATASFNGPMGLVLDAASNVYVADWGNNAIRKITPAGVVSTLAGSSAGTAGSVNGTGTAASFNQPNAVALDAAGNIIVADSQNNLIRKVTPAGVVTTLAGSGALGAADGAVAAASFAYPMGLTFDAAGNLYVADNDNGAIRMITPGGVVSTVVGTPPVNANLMGPLPGTMSYPTFLTLSPLTGNLFIAGRNAILEAGWPTNAATVLPGGPAITAPATVVTGANNTASVAAQTDSTYTWGITNGTITSGAGTNQITYTASGSGSVGLTCTVTSASGTATVQTPATSVVLSAGQAVFEQFTLAPNAAYLADWVNLPTSGAPVSGTHYLGLNHHSMAASPAVHGPQTLRMSQMATLDPALPLPPTVTVPNRYLVNGQIVVGSGPYPGWNETITYPGTGVRSDLLAVDGSTIVSSVLIANLVSVPLSGTVASAPSDLVNFMGNVFSNASLINPNAIWASGAAYYQCAKVYASDVYYVRDFGPPTTGTTPMPFATGTTLATLIANSTLTGGTASTVNGVPIYVSNTLSPGGLSGPFNTTYYQLNGNVYVGAKFSAGAALRDTVRLNQAAVLSLQAALPALPDPSFQLSAGSMTSLGNVNYMPLMSTFLAPHQLAVDPAGILYVADGTLSAAEGGGTGNNEIRAITPAMVSIYGGTSVYGATAVLLDPQGLVYVSCSDNTLRTVNPGGVVTVLAGTPGVTGHADGTGSQASFNGPASMAWLPSGNLVVADALNNTLRMVTPAGVVTTLAGQAGVTGSADNAVATLATFNVPVSPAVDASGNIFVADSGNQTVRVLPAGGGVATFAGRTGVAVSADGQGTAASFNGPHALAFDAAGTLYVLEQGGGNLRQITPAGTVTTVFGAAGSSLAPWAPGSLNGLAINLATGNLYLTFDTGTGAGVLMVIP